MPENMGGGAGAVRLAELDQLRVLVRREFEPPLTTDDLIEALTSTNHRIHEAYHFLKQRRHQQRQEQQRQEQQWQEQQRQEQQRQEQQRQEQQQLQQQVATARIASAFATAATESASEEMAAAAKRRLGLVDHGGPTPTKRPKNDSYDSNGDDLFTQATQDEDDVDSAQDDAEMVETEPQRLPQDTDRATQLLTDVVRARARDEAVANGNWADEIRDALHVLSSLEIVMQLNLTADAMAVWVKKTDDQDSAEKQKEAIDLVVASVALLPAQGSDHDTNGRVEELLNKQEEEIAALESTADQQQTSRRPRATAAQNMITVISKTCRAHLRQLQRMVLQEEHDGGSLDSQRALAEMGERLASLVKDQSAEVAAAEHTVHEVRQLKETRARLLQDFVDKRVQYLMQSGDTEFSAKLDAYAEMFKSDDDEIAALRVSRDETNERVRNSQAALDKANSSLLFYQNALALFEKIRASRERKDEEVHARFQRARSVFEVRTAEFVKRTLPTMSTALQEYFSFRTVQETDARQQQEDRERALQRHLDIYGDSAPIQQGDIEQRIVEFKTVRSRAQEHITDMVKQQLDLWIPSRALLSPAVWTLVVQSYSDLYNGSSVVVREAMEPLVSGLKERPAHETVAEPSSAPEPPSSRELSPPADSTMELFRGAYDSEDTVVGAYRAAVSPVEAARQSDPPVVLMLSHTTPPPTAVALPRSQALVSTSNVHEFPIGSVLFTKFNVGDNCSQFFRGKVVELLTDGSYRMQYDDGDIFSVQRPFLFTQAQMDSEMKAGQQHGDAASGSATDGGNCTIM